MLTIYFSSRRDFTFLLWKKWKIFSKKLRFILIFNCYWVWWCLYFVNISWVRELRHYLTFLGDVLRNGQEIKKRYLLYCVTNLGNNLFYRSKWKSVECRTLFFLFFLLFLFLFLSFWKQKNEFLGSSKYHIIMHTGRLRPFWIWHQFKSFKAETRRGSAFFLLEAGAPSLHRNSFLRFSPSTI